MQFLSTWQKRKRKSVLSSLTLVSQIKSSETQQLLGVSLDSKLSFKKHVDNLCKKTSQKLHALTRVSKYMTPEKVKCVMRTFVLSQFNYCPLIWMFNDRSTNNRISHIHERALRIAYRDENSTFEELLIKDNSVCIHHKNLQSLMIEIYKTRNNLNPPFMKDIFEAREICYNLRKHNTFFTHKAKTILMA